MQTVIYLGESTLAIDAVAKELLREDLFSSGEWLIELTYTDTGKVRELTGHLVRFFQDENSSYLHIEISSGEGKDVVTIPTVDIVTLVIP